MEKISLLALRRDLTRIRQRLKAGESFLVTERGTVIAFLQPVIVGVDYAAGVDTTVTMTRDSDGVFTVLDVARRGKE